MQYFPLILIGVFLNAAAQLLLKEGMRRIGYFDFAWASALPVVTQVAASPFVLIGLTLYIVSVAVWLVVLSRVDVGYAYPMLSLGYLINAVAGHYLFNENLSLTRLGGVLVIIAGVYLISRS